MSNSPAIFHPVEICPRIVYPNSNQHSRLDNVASLSKQHVLESILDSALAIAYVDDLTFYPITHSAQSILEGNKTLLSWDDQRISLSPQTSSIEQLYVIPISPWGASCDIMHIFLGLNESYLSTNQTLLLSMQNSWLKVINSYLKNNVDTVCIGCNWSPTSLYGKGLQSVVWPHLHIWQSSLAASLLTPSAIIARRSTPLWNNQYWEDQIASDICTEINIQSQGWEVDAQGAHLRLPNTTAEKFWQELGGLFYLQPTIAQIEARLINLEEEIFSSTHSQRLQYINDIKKNLATYDHHTYQSLTQLKTPVTKLAQKIYQLHSLHNHTLRPGFGYTISICHNKQDTFVALTIVTTTQSMGPVETLGIRLERPDLPASPQLTQEFITRAQAIIKDIY